jgi:hypothetical protein
MVDIDKIRRKILLGLAGLVGTAVLGVLTFKYGINNSLYQNISNNLNNNSLYQKFSNNFNSSQYIFWNVPWGPGNGTYKLLNPYFQSNYPITEGVIVTFNDNYDYSLDQILYLYENNKNKKPIYINLFVTTDRDTITNLSQYNQSIEEFLKYLSTVTNGGENIIIGFSEIDEAPIEQLAYYYYLMKKYLPKSKLFYYADIGNSERIEELSNYLLNNYGIKLDIIGLEVYGNYIYNDRNISMSEYIINTITQYKQFADENNITFFIGELGFRDGDLEGYVNSGDVIYLNGPSEQGYQDTIEYYEDIISQLHEMGINIIGIYNWNGANGDPFGLWNNPYFNNLIDYIISNSNSN